MTNKEPKISIFIPTYKDETDLSACLESINELDYPKEKIEIVIWDNCSQDDTVRMVQERFVQMRNDGWLNLSLTAWNKNEGTYVPYNLAVPNLSPETEYILGLDADVELAPDLVTRLVSAVQEEHVAVVGARSVYFDGPELTSHGAGFVSRRTAFYSESDAGKRVECDYVIGCCLLLDKEVFVELNCFDPDYYISHWEVDYCLRAKEKGFRVLYEPTAVVKHKIPLNPESTPERIYYLFRNKLLMIRKNPTLFKFSWTIPMSFGFSLMRILFSLSWSIPWPCTKNALAGLRDGLMDKRGKRKILL